MTRVLKFVQPIVIMFREFSQYFYFVGFLLSFYTIRGTNMLGWY